MTPEQEAVKDEACSTENYNGIAVPFQQFFIKLVTEECKTVGDFITISSAASIVFGEALVLSSKSMFPNNPIAQTAEFLRALEVMFSALAADGVTAILHDDIIVPSIPIPR